MTQEEKELLLKDLCARLPYGVICTDLRHGDSKITEVDTEDGLVYCYDFDEYIKVDDCRLYLRPMSSMTEDEKDELYDWGWEVNGDDICSGASTDANNVYQTYQKDLHDARWLINWLNSHHFDFRGLIEKSLAIVAPEEMYKNE